MGWIPPGSCTANTVQRCPLSRTGVTTNVPSVRIHVHWRVAARQAFRLCRPPHSAARAPGRCARAETGGGEHAAGVAAGSAKRLYSRYLLAASAKIAPLRRDGTDCPPCTGVVAAKSIGVTVRGGRYGAVTPSYPLSVATNNQR